MNNLRLLTGLLTAVLSGGGAYTYGRTAMSLEDIFAAAEANSVQLRPALTSQTEAEREINVARAGRLPDISTTLSLSYIGDGFTTKRDFSDYMRAPIPHLGNGLAVTVTQPVYTGGAVSSAIDMAELKSTAARYAAELRRNDIRLRLTGYYLDLYRYMSLRRVVDANIAAAQKVLREMRARHAQGTALRNDITRYELLVSNLGLQLVRIDNTLYILNTDLVTTAGLPEGTVVEPDSTLPDRALPRDGAEWWQGEAQAHSPALGMAQTGVDISRKAEALVRSERLPKIGVQAGWTIDGPILVEIPPVNRNLSYWYVGVNVSYSLSSLYKSNRKLARSRTATRRAAEEHEAAREELRLTVNADHVRYLEAYEEVKTQQKSVELAEQNYRTASTRYAAGMALVTDMLDAANAKLEAEQQLVNSRINIIYYYYKLLFDTGKI